MGVESVPFVSIRSRSSKERSGCEHDNISVMERRVRYFLARSGQVFLGVCRIGRLSYHTFCMIIEEAFSSLSSQCASVWETFGLRNRAHRVHDVGFRRPWRDLCLSYRSRLDDQYGFCFWGSRCAFV